IVTQTGATALFAAGDTFMLRATAADTVELLSALPNASVGQSKLVTAVLPPGPGQTTQNLVASRLAATNYTNSSGRTVEVTVTVFGTDLTDFSVTRAGVTIIQSRSGGTGYTQASTAT